MIQQVRIDLLEFMKQSNKSQKQISKETGLSTALISQFLNSTYTGDNEEVAKAIQQYLDIGNERLKTVNSNEFYCNLSNTMHVLSAALYAHKNCEIALVCGDAGAGKTTALKHYCDNNTGVIFITANASSRTARAILYMITEALGKQPASSEFLLMRNLVSYLKGTNRLIIIGEADHLNAQALQAVRNLNDEAGIGLLFSGNDKIHNQMYGRGSLQFDQLRTRIGIRIKVTNDYLMEEIQNVFPNLSDECNAYLLKIACNESLRAAKKCYKVASQFAISRNIKLTAKHLKDTQKQLFNSIL